MPGVISLDVLTRVTGGFQDVVDPINSAFPQCTTKWDAYGRARSDALHSDARHHVLGKSGFDVRHPEVSQLQQAWRQCSRPGS
jgi:hypothetical protein